MARIDKARVRNLVREARLNRRRAAEGIIRGKRVKFTPVNDMPQTRLEDIEKNGAIIGLLETEAEERESPLPPGKYHAFVVRDPSEGWLGYFVDKEGNVRAQAARVEISPYKGRRRKAQVEEGSWFKVLAILIIAVVAIIAIIIV